MKYSTKKIEEVCIRVLSGGTPKTTNIAFYNPKEVPWLKTAEVNYCRIYDTETYISKEGLARSSARIIPSDSVIIAMYGDTAGRVAINKIPLCTNQACCNLIIDHDSADYEYVYYALSSLYGKMVSLKNGGAQPNLNAGIIKALEIPFPELDIQKKIASILSHYDYLIENNKRQIKLLEELAQRLYKEWFVDLRFPGYENVKIIEGIPEGWNEGTLDNIVIFKRGKTITKGQVSEGKVPVVAGGLSPAYYHNKANTIAPVITVSGSGANAGFTRLYHEDVFASDCSYADKNSTPYLLFVYCFLKENKSGLDALQKGSAQPHVYAKDINSLFMLVPSEKIIELFCDSVFSYFEKIKVLQRTSKLLFQARDRLLPKLMSGEITI
ncbi:restriction endonuclease subunit S [Oribacterium sinus]